MRTKSREHRHRGLTPAFLLGALAVAGACDHDDESNERPAGFSEQDAACSSLAPAAFVREGNRIVSRALAAAERRAGRGALGAPGQLGVDVKGGFAEGLRLVSPTSPGADVTFTPLGAASRAPGRLRRDGAFVAYDDAYAGVGVALGASDRRVEERVRVAGPDDRPALRFRLRGGPAFGRWHDEGGALFAYDSEGRGLFEFAPPSVEDASGRLLRGRWHVVESGEGPGESKERVVEAELPWGEVVFPALVAIGFETPTWFPAGGPSPPAPRAGAGLAFYGAGQGCALL